MMRLLLLIFLAQQTYGATPLNPNKKATPPKASKVAEEGFYPALSLGVGFRSFSGKATVGYDFNRYLAAEGTAFYRQIYNGDRYEKAFGFEGDGIFKLANPTLLTPYTGLGIGYVKWQRVYDGQEFDSAASPFWTYFLGIDARLTSFLSIVGESKWMNYVRAPKDYSDLDSLESRNQYQFIISFVAHFSFED